LRKDERGGGAAAASGHHRYESNHDDRRLAMDCKTWFMMTVALLPGIGLIVGSRGVGVGQAASAEDEAQAAAMFESSPALPKQLFRVEWVTSPDRSGRSRIKGSVYNDSGRTALNVQLRISEVDAAGEAVSSVNGPVLESVPGLSQVYFDVQVPGNSKSYRMAVASFSFDFADPGSK
jgi:hypothetical protein